MNFLAHLYLAKPTPASWIGNILPDLCRGPIDPALPADLHEGAHNHRRIDAFTDTHPLFHQSRLRLFPYHGRFSGILVDMLYDHILARDWPRYSTEPLSAFIARVHAAFDEHSHLMPPAMGPIVHRMCEQDWLSSYASREGLRLALTRMSARFSHRFGREVALAEAVDLLDPLGEALAEDFHLFFPLLVAHVRRTQALAIEPQAG